MWLCQVVDMGLVGSLHMIAPVAVTVATDGCSQHVWDQPDSQPYHSPCVGSGGTDTTLREVDDAD